MGLVTYRSIRCQWPSVSLAVITVKGYVCAKRIQVGRLWVRIRELGFQNYSRASKATKSRLCVVLTESSEFESCQSKTVFSLLLWPTLAIEIVIFIWHRLTENRWYPQKNSRYGLHIFFLSGQRKKYLECWLTDQELVGSNAGIFSSWQLSFILYRCPESNPSWR